MRGAVLSLWVGGKQWISEAKRSQIFIFITHRMSVPTQRQARNGCYRKLKLALDKAISCCAATFQSLHSTHVVIIRSVSADATAF